jgi:hypothetical protein
MKRFFLIVALIACVGLLTAGCCCCNNNQQTTYQGKYKTIWPDGNVTYSDIRYEFTKYETNSNGDSDFVGKAPIKDSTPGMFTESTSQNAYVIDVSQINPESVTFIYPPDFFINSQGFNKRFEANNYDNWGGDYVTTDLIGPILGLEYKYGRYVEDNENEEKKFYASFSDRGEDAITTYRTWYNRNEPDGFILSHYKFDGVTYTPFTTGDEIIVGPVTTGQPTGLKIVHCDEGDFPNGLNVYDYTFDKINQTYKQDNNNNNSTNGAYL